MPFIEDTYKPSLMFRNTHLNTLYASKFRKLRMIDYRRERFPLSGGDFIDVDWNDTGSNSLLVVLHGLGGHASRTYVRGMVNVFEKMGYDSAAFNMLGCSGEMNPSLQTYHSGRTGDLRHVVDTIVSRKRYKRLILSGFSLGANMILKYLGEEGSRSPFNAAIAVSGPIELVSCSIKLEKSSYYMSYFLVKLRRYLEQKQKFHPEISLEGYEKIKTFRQYDDRYTAPFNGFSSAQDYWEKSSALQYMPEIKTPTLLLNASDDPVLTESCFPADLARENPAFYLGRTRFGGHTGYVLSNPEQEYWHEKEAKLFLERQDLLIR